MNELLNVLQSVGMQQHYDALKRNGFDSVEAFALADDADLVICEIPLLGHRKVLAALATKLRAEIHQLNSSSNNTAASSLDDNASSLLLTASAPAAAVAAMARMRAATSPIHHHHQFHNATRRLRPQPSSATSVHAAPVPVATIVSPPTSASSLPTIAMPPASPTIQFQGAPMYSRNFWTRARAREVPWDFDVPVFEDAEQQPKLRIFLVRHGQCFPAADHQILTDRGFCFYEQIAALSDNEFAHLRVASYDRAARRLVYVRPRALVVDEAARELVEFSSHAASINVVVTRNHNMLIGDAANKISADQLLHKRDRLSQVNFLTTPINGHSGDVDHVHLDVDACVKHILQSQTVDDKLLFGASTTMLRAIVRALGGGQLFARTVDFRDALQRLLLHAGFSATFEGTVAAGWTLSYNKTTASSPIDVVNELTSTSQRCVKTWCFDVDDGCVVVRRAVRDACGVVVRASRPTIQGNSLANIDHNLYKQIADHAIPLSPLGEKQALEAGRSFRKFLQRETPDGLPSGEHVRLWTSTYKRARQTAELFKTGAGEFITDMREDVLLGEQQWGLFEGYDWKGEQIEIDYPRELSYYRKATAHGGRFWAKVPLGESRFDVCLRAKLFLGTLFRDAYRHGINNVVIVSHGVTIRAFMMMFLHLTPEWLEVEPNPKNASIRVIDKCMDAGWIWGSAEYPRPDLLIDPQAADPNLADSHVLMVAAESPRSRRRNRADARSDPPTVAAAFASTADDADEVEDDNETLF
jgi:2,3-bisphosphoglycerate-dependent phosphoglycerate mutase